MFSTIVFKVLPILVFTDSSLAGAGSKLCEQRGSPVHGVTHVKLKRPSGIAVVYTCEPDYVLQGAALAVCVHGVWTHELPSCNRTSPVLGDVNDGIASDSGVIVSMSELDTIPTPNNEDEDKKQRMENKVKERKVGRKKRKRKGKRKNHKRGDRHKVAGTDGFSRASTARRKVFDMSCLLGTVQVPGFVRAPAILNAFSPKYSRRKNQKGRYLAAVYICIPGYSLRNLQERTLACSRGRWVGRRPVCVPVKGVAKTSDSCVGAGCDHDCKDVDGQPQCFCFKGFKQDGRLCHDVNECATEDNGGCEEICVNTPGSYFCKCKKGFRLAYDRSSCEDINECTLRNGHGPCQDQCYNLPGSYRCSCEDIPGTELAEDQHSCQDIDECNDTEHSLGCSHSCINTIGTAFCHCPEGYVLGPDWKTCADLNKCEQEGCGLGCASTMGCSEAAGSCAQGFIYKKGECIDVDECEDSPCSQDCLNTPGSFICSCSNGYNLGDDQKTCHDLDECAEYSSGTFCSHECINTVGSYICECPDNHELATDHRTCHLIEDECQKKNCSHDCLIENGTAVCVCDTGFYLENNDTCTDIDECLQEPGCSHECVNEEGTYRCLCPKGFYLLSDNKNCKLEKECPVECTNGCSHDSGVIKCSCPDGFFLKHDLFCEDINECLEERICSHLCTNTEGGYTCECPEGYQIGSDKKTCQDINECLLKIDEDSTICSHNCTNTVGSYKCECPPGFLIARDSRTCEDIDECFDNNEINNRCSHVCVNEIGSYHCECPEGYTAEENICKEINECEINNGNCSHICIERTGSRTCDCPRYFYLADDNVTCLEVACRTNCSQQCNNETCSCFEGYVLSSDLKTCTDLNECLNDNGNCSQICTNVDGSYHCGCDKGFKLNEDLRECDDIDECQVNNGGCSQLCTNNNGSFACSCYPGFALQSDFTCEDINECGESSCSDTDECEHVCAHICVNTVGSFHCQCEEGYLSSKDGKSCLPNQTESLNKPDFTNCTDGFKFNNDSQTCEDINECLDNISNCSQLCDNTIGSYMCGCKSGFVMSANNGNTCVDDDECVEKNLCSQICENTVGSFICACRSGYTLINQTLCQENTDPCEVENGGCSQYCNSSSGHVVCSCDLGFALLNGSQCEDIDECLMNNTCDQKCRNTNGSYECACHDGYYKVKDKCVEIPGCKPLKSVPHMLLNCSISKRVTYSVGTECFATCSSGFKIDGFNTVSCKADGSWSRKELRCIPVSRPFIRCQREIRQILPKGQKEMLVQIPRPKTNMDWKRNVESKPPWGKELQKSLPLGITRVTFSATSPDSDYVSSCTVLIHILDMEKPQFDDCPSNILLWLKPESKSQKVIWREPVFRDNVKVSHVYKSKVPGQEFLAGVHRVSYVAADSSGNIATCQFTVTIKDFVV